MGRVRGRPERWRYCVHACKGGAGSFPSLSFNDLLGGNMAVACVQVTWPSQCPRRVACHSRGGTASIAPTFWAARHRQRRGVGELELAHSIHKLRAAPSQMAAALPMRHFVQALQQTLVHGARRLVTLQFGFTLGRQHVYAIKVVRLASRKAKSWGHTCSARSRRTRWRGLFWSTIPRHGPSRPFCRV